MISDVGIEVATIRLARKLPRKNRTIKNTNVMAQKTLSRRLNTEAMMNSELSMTTFMVTSGGRFALTSSSLARTALETSTVLPPLCFWTKTAMACLPLRRTS